MAATIIIIIITLGVLGHFLIGATSDGSAEAPPICGTEAVWLHAKEFPGYVETALNAVVRDAAPKFQWPGLAQATDVECSTLYPPDQGHGAAWAESTCYAGVTPGDCTRCLSDAVPFLRECESKTHGGAFFPGRCWLRFRQYLP